MSSGNKTLATSSSSGRSTNKNKSSQQHGKSDQHHSKTTDTAKHDKGQSKDQAKHAQIIDTRSGGIEDPAMRERIKQAMEATHRTEDQVIMALHDSDWDVNRAVNDLIEGVSAEWEVKKKKARQPGGSKTAQDQTTDHEDTGDWEERRNQRGGGPPRLRGRANHDNRGWRGRENKENERNMEDNVREGGYGGGRRGGRGGPGRSGRGGRGGGRGLGPRTFANRGDSASSSSHSFNRPIDTWTGSEEQQQSTQDPKIDPWNSLEPSEDWYTEEYTGSLADTKVFTPSTAMGDQPPTDDVKPDVQVVQPVQHGTLGITEDSKLADAPLQQPSQSQQPQTPAMMQSQSQVQQPSPQQVLGMPTQLQMSQQASTVGGGALTAAQSQYLTQLTQQSSENYKATGQSAFTSMGMTNQAQRPVKQRPRVPPPSKIPSSAVEMPGDVNNSIGFLDVQFGALEFGSDAGSIENAATEKYNSTNTSITGIDVTSTASTVNSTTTSNSLDIEPPPQQQQQQQQQQAPQQQQQPQPTSAYNATPQQIVQSPSNNSVGYGNTSTGATNYSQKNSYQSQNQPASYNYTTSSTQSGQSTFPSAPTVGSSNNYTTTTTQSGYSGTTSSYPQTNQSTFSQQSPSTAQSTSSTSGGYNQSGNTNQSYQSSSFVPTTTGQYQSTPQSTNSGSNSSYQGTSYQTSSSFQSTPQAYQPSGTTFTSPITQGSSNAYQSAAHSVYGSAYGNYSTQPQATSHNHTKLNSGSGKDSQYDNNATTSSGSLATTSAPSLGLSSASANSSQTKVTSSNAVPKSTSSGSTVSGASGTGSITGSGAGAASSMTPMLGHTGYIMGQGVPYAFQQHMYSYEELQLMQQRIPHMPTTGYYDAALGYQTTGPATSLGGGRSDALSGVQGVQSVQGVQGAYTSMSDGRFARNDSNASPVPSTMSQQTASQHQQPMMNPTLPPGYAYFYSGGIMPGSFQAYGGPAIYPQIPTAGNAGTNSAAYNAKPGSYGSGYGGGASYDTLANAGPTGEYKGAGSGYTGTQTGKTGTSTGNNNSGASSATDIGATMYAKSHVALSKVNSYDKQTFHSATPPPFGLTGSQSAGMPGGYGGPHLFISTMPHQLHQPLHQDGGSSSGQRSNASSQNKAQAKPGYSSTYWTAGN